jgi:uncharacterized membrane protein YoaK (UPF0700 family)
LQAQEGPAKVGECPIVPQACLLAIIAGYADTVGYLRYEAFAGLMTGNTIFLGSELATGRYGLALFHGGIIAVFLLGVVLSRVLIRLGLAAWHALTIASLMLVVCGFISHGAAALLLALAMGMQNSAANRFNGVALNTVFVTGNLQKLGEGIVAWAWAKDEARQKALEGTAIFAYVWLAYAAGAASGAVANGAMSYPLLLPAAILPFIMLRAPDP